MKNYVAEAFGTFVLVFVGCGTAVLAGAAAGHVGIAFAFGLAVVAAAYMIGGISGCHINPAISIGMWSAGRLSKTDLIGYCIGQVAGAVLAAFILMIIVKGKLSGYDISANGLGQNGFGEGYLGEYGFLSAVLFEFFATLIFVTTVLEATEDQKMSQIAGLIVGLTLVGIHLVGIQVTGVSVNPARSFGPALFAGPYAWAQLPVFIIVPLLAGMAAGWLSKSHILTADDKSNKGDKAIAELTEIARQLSARAGETVSAGVEQVRAKAQDVVGNATGKSSAEKAPETVKTSNTAKVASVEAETTKKPEAKQAPAKKAPAKKAAPKKAPAKKPSA